MRNNLFAVSLLAGASLLALASGASAQTAPTQSSPATPTSTDEVVVTGSRTIRNGNASPTPITVVQTQDVLNMKPGLLTDALTELPALAGSLTTTAAVDVAGAATGGNSSSDQLSMRNLGENRTLVLMDGQQLVPTTYDGGTDVDIVPQELIQRVDVVTGGVSAVYGSDAVAGVVNYILDKHFNGFKLDANAGESQRSDDRKYTFAIAGGADLFGGRGHIEASYEYIDQSGITAKSDVPWLDQWGVSGAGTAANPYVLQQDLRLSTFPAGGLITNGVLSGQAFGSNGVLSPFVNGTATGSSTLQVGGEGGYYDPTLITPEQANQFFGRFDYDLTSDVHAYFQVAGELKSQIGYADQVKLTNATFSAANPYLPPVAQAQLAAAGQSTFALSELMGPYSRYEAQPTTDEYIVTGGFQGSIDNYQWDVIYNHGMAMLSTPISNNENEQHLAAALDAVVNPANGQIVCNVTLTNPSADPGCVPLNVFGPTAANSSALNSYVLQPTTYNNNNGLDELSGHITGSPISAPAGPVEVALSAEWRRLTFSQSTTAPPTLANCSGLRYNCTSTTPLWEISFADEAQVQEQVSEGALEVDLPVIKDAPFIKAFSINGAARYTAYSTVGDYITWKIGGNWQVNDNLRFRATQSRDIEAPTLYQLYSPPAPVPISAPDLLTGLTVSALSSDITNPNLKAELANTTTAGFVWTPTRQISFTVDAYEIIIHNAITDISGDTAIYQDACYASGGTSIFCTLQPRPLGNYTNTTAANAATVWNNLEMNLSELQTYGADFEFNYIDTVLNHPASLRVLASYQPHDYQFEPGVVTSDAATVSFPVWRISAFLHYEPTQAFLIDVLERYRTPMEISNTPGQVVLNNTVAAFYTTDTTLSYRLGSTPLGQTLVDFNITNLFDAQAPGYANARNAGRLALRDGWEPGDDPVGRAFMFGIKIRH